MSKRALWLAGVAVSLGFVVVSCTGSDGSSNFSSGGESAAGDGNLGGGESQDGGSSSTSGKNGGGSSAEAGQAQGGMGSNVAGQANGDAGSENPASGGAPEGGTSGVGEGGAGGGGVVRTPCENYKQCEVGEVCVKEECDEQKQGVCMNAPADVPLCGCDGITYFDGALVASAEMTVRSRSICGPKTAVACEGKCEGGYVCGRVELRDGDCEQKLGGVCWALPKECPKDEPALFNICGSEKCLDMCEAIASGEHVVHSELSCGIIN